MTMKFQIGRTYSTRSACDHNCIFAFTIVARTEKTVTFEHHGETKKRGLRVHDGMESFKPFGSYSMAPVICADD